MYCVGRWVDNRGMRGGEERVIYGICKSTGQDEAFYNSEVKEDQVPSRAQRRGRDKGNGGQVDRHS